MIENITYEAAPSLIAAEKKITSQFSTFTQAMSSFVPPQANGTMAFDTLKMDSQTLIGASAFVHKDRLNALVA